MLMNFSGPLYDCAEGEMKCATRRMWLDHHRFNKIIRRLEDDHNVIVAGWPCIPQESYYDDVHTDCLDMTDESK